MDVVGWLVGTAIMVGAAVTVACAPALHRAHRRRQEQGGAGGFAGVGAGFDSVWRPSADEARNDWESTVEAPAPAPVPGDKGRIAGGRIIIRADRHSGD